MKYRWSTLLVVVSMVSWNLPAFAVSNCTDFNGTWVGTCERENLNPSPTNATLVLNISEDCSLITSSPTGMSFTTFTDFRVGKDMQRVDTNTVNPIAESHLHNSRAINWSPTEGIFKYTIAGSTVNFINFPTGAKALRSLQTGESDFTVEGDKLKTKYKSDVQVWENGLPHPLLKIKEDCTLFRQ